MTKKKTIETLEFSILRDTSEGPHLRAFIWTRNAHESQDVYRRRPRKLRRVISNRKNYDVIIMVRIAGRRSCGRFPSAVIGHDPHIVHRCYCSHVVVFVNKKQLNRGGNGGRRRPSGRRRRRSSSTPLPPKPRALVTTLRFRFLRTEKSAKKNTHVHLS